MFSLIISGNPANLGRSRVRKTRSTFETTSPREQRPQQTTTFGKRMRCCHE